MLLQLAVVLRVAVGVLLAARGREGWQGRLGLWTRHTATAWPAAAAWRQVPPCQLQWLLQLGWAWRQAMAAWPALLAAPAVEGCWREVVGGSQVQGLAPAVAAAQVG
jgi:hypothetical protein